MLRIYWECSSRPQILDSSIIARTGRLLTGGFISMCSETSNKDLWGCELYFEEV